MRVTHLKLALIALLATAGLYYLRVDYWIFRHLWSSFLESRKFAGLLVYTGVFAALYASIPIAMFLRAALPRIAFGILVALNLTALIMYCRVTSFHSLAQSTHGWKDFDFAIIETLWVERAHIPAVAPEFAGDIALAALLLAIIAGIACARPAPGFELGGRLWTAFPVAAVAAMLALVIHTRGGTQGFPSPASFVPRAALTVMWQNLAPPVPLARSSLPAPPGTPIRKIVLIMDESVRSDFTALGRPGSEVTPFLASLDERLISFGNATSAHNCSLVSRYIMRYGIRPAELPAALAPGLNHPGPMIWQLARDAGYATLHINGMAGIEVLGGGASLREARHVDRLIPAADATASGRDTVVAEKLIAALAEPGRAFLYVDKFGVHIPYADKYPAGRVPFAVPASGSAQARTLAHYKNAVSWSVDEFFRRLLPALDLGETLILYTSDHGQNLDVERMKSRHCNSVGAVAHDEALVPMAAITTNPEWQARLGQAAKANRGAASHFQILPTLLLAMGYPEAQVLERYGPSLLHPAPQKRRFLVGGGRSLRWVDAD